MVLSQWCPSGVPVVSQWCIGGVWCLGGVSVSHCWSGHVSVVSQWCPGRVPWCPGGVAVCPVVSRWLVPPSCPGRVVFQWCPVVSRWLVSQWCLEGVPVLFQWCPGRVPCFLGPGGVPPSGVPAVSGVPRGGVPVSTTISENLRLRGGWCSAGEEEEEVVPVPAAPKWTGHRVLLVRWLVGLRWGGAGR